MTPDSISSTVDPELLTEAFRRAGFLRDGRVKEVKSDGYRMTILSRVERLHLTYDGSIDDAPTSVFLKSGQPERAVRRWLAYRHEVDFYVKVAPKMSQGIVPKCFDANCNEATRDFRLILEDLTETHKLLQTPWPLPPTIDECKQLLSAWARCHAAWWDSPELGNTIGQWPDLADPQIQVFAEKFGKFEKELGERLSHERRDIYRRLIDKGPSLNARNRSYRNMTIVHGDSHPRNVLLPLRTGDSARIFDWDGWRVGVATNDIAYMMAVHWFPDYRRRFETTMLDYYHNELLLHGVSGYDRRALWEDYRLSTLWQIATPVWQCVGKVPPGIWWNHLDRIFSAIDDLGCRDLIA